MFEVDLHIHTTESDGVLTPEEMVSWAVRNRLKAIAITDHDTVNGIDSAINHATDDLIIVPGIELSTYSEKQEVHILGYYLDYHSKSLSDILIELKNSRHVRAEAMLKKLSEIKGIHLSMEEVKRFSKDAPIGRPHIARAMVDLGLAPSVKYVFENLIGYNCPAYVKRHKLSPEEAVKLIEAYNGISVIAHPGLLTEPKELKRLLSIGIRGVEVYHPFHDAETTYKLLLIAKSKGLLVTGGTDNHGERRNECTNIGDMGIKWDDYLKLYNYKMNNTN